jgi:hypothetical protein
MYILYIGRLLGMGILAIILGCSNSSFVSNTLAISEADESQEGVQYGDTSEILSETPDLIEGLFLEHEDSYVQTEPTLKKLDLSVIVDNSGSMKQEQVNLSTKLSVLLNHIDQSDWQLGVNSTDYRDRNTLKLLLSRNSTQSKSTKIKQFENAINALGIKGSGNEMGIFMAANALSQDWVRKDSYLAVLIVSDEDNCSNARGCNSIDPRYNFHTYLAETMESLGRELKKTAKVYSIHRRNQEECAKTAHFIGNEYNAIVDKTAGLSGSICSEDYTPVLQAISADLAVTMNLAFTLSQTPHDGKITVLVDGKKLEDGYELQDRSLIFAEGSAPGAGQKIQVKYAIKEL